MNEELRLLLPCKGGSGWMDGADRREGDHVTDGVATDRPGVIINVTCSKFDSQRRRW